MTLALDRRQLLRLGLAAAAAWELAPWAPDVSAAGPLPEPPVVDLTIEAFADTLVPGQKRFPRDRAVAGAAKGPGAVQAGALDFMRFPAVGVGPLLPAFAAAVNAEAVTYAVANGLVLDPVVPPFVALDFTHRTRLAVQLLDFSRPDYLLYYALAALAFLAFHTAGHLHTADAVRAGHPGLKRLGFPKPEADGLWRFPGSSYKKRLARNHPGTTAKGHPR